MATSSLAAALETSDIVRHIDSCTGLFPGVAASTENLQPLWEHISETKCWVNGEDDVTITMVHHDDDVMEEKNPRLYIDIEGPDETIASDVQGFWAPQRAHIDRKSFDGSIDGLAEALAYAKNTADRVRRKEFCSRCCSDGLKKVEGKLVFPVKKLKARPLPYCAECTIDLATGGPPQKKVRHG
jgi:hypothetical protein